MSELLRKMVLSEIAAKEEQLINYRRHFHQYPELSFQEYKTSQFIYDEMSQLNNVEVTRPTATSVLVKISGYKPGQKIGLRADIDALPIQEERDFEFKSTIDGVMHACGHDGHAAMLMVATQIISEHADELAGDVYSIFQHAEELQPGGAKELVATGQFDDFAFIYGHHLMTTIPKGIIDVKSGPNTANSDRYTITINGKGGHASQPENCVDPTIIGGQILSQMQTIVSRRLKPQHASVISNTVFQAGNKSGLNIIPDKAYMAGSVRTAEIEDRFIIEDEIEKIVKSVCESYGATYEYEFVYGYSAVVNDEYTTQQVATVVTDLFPNEQAEVPMLMGGEDFSAFSQLVPSTYIFIGCGNSEGHYDYAHHHPKFAIDESVLIKGVQLFVAVALNYTHLTHPTTETVAVKDEVMSYGG